MYVGKVKYGNNTWPVGSTLYGTCNTAADTVEKTVTLADFDTLLEGVTIHVKFTYSNTASNPTLNVNSTGAYAIKRYGTKAPGTSSNSSWNAGSVVSFTYDGTYWQLNDWLNNNTTYTFDGTYDASTNKAATVNTVTNAINALDGGTIGTGGSGKTITSLSQTNGNVSATFGDISITKSQVSDFPSLATVATSGSYNDLSNKPTIPSAANNGTFSVKTKVGSNDAVTAADFTANQSSADDITFIQGSNVTLTTDTTNRTVTIAAKDTTYTFDGTYNSSTNKAATVSTVTNAIATLDGTVTGSAGSGKTITAFSQTDGKVSATFGDISITKSQVSDFPTIPTVNNAKFSVKGDGTEVASTTANASSASSVDIVAGSNVTVTPDATNKKITIAAKDTTYSTATTSAAGLMSADDKTKLNGIAAGADVNVQSDWNATSGDAFIKNKPTIPDSFQWFGTSSTAADVVQKEVSIPSITSLKTGQIIVVKPTVTSTVANSTLKLNDFDAYPMRYNNAAITTGTDSIVWSANIPSLFVFDGSYWEFLGHGLDSNTTYSAMSVAEGTAGTKTSARTMRADYLKQIIQALAPQSDWNATSGDAVILNKPTIPTVNNGKFSIKGAGTEVVSTTANASSDSSVDIVAGSNVTITPDATNKKITIASTDTNTTYSAGTGLSLSGTTFSVKTGYTTSGNNRAVQADSNGNLYVTQKDDNATYTFTDNNPTLAWGTKSKVATVGGTDIHVTMPANPNTNTTYTIATGDSDGQIKVTPSSGSAYNVSVKGLGSRAYDSTSYLPLAGGTLTGGLNFKFGHDLTQTNNGVESVQYYGIRMYDKNNYYSAQLLNQVQTDGTNALNFNLRNRNGSTEYDKSLMIYLTKAGVISASLGGAFTANSFIKSGGTSSQFLKADGSVDSNSYLTSITKTMVTNALGYTPPTTDTNTWRGITDSYSGTDSSISLSQKGGNALYNALLNGYASSAGYADSASYASSIPSRTIWGQSFNGTANVNGTFYFTNGDATMKIYGAPSTVESYGNERVAIQTSFDMQDPETSSYPTNYPTRAALLLQPRGGYVGIGTTSPSTRMHVVGRVTCEYSSAYSGSFSAIRDVYEGCFGINSSGYTLLTTNKVGDSSARVRISLSPHTITNSIIILNDNVEMSNGSGIYLASSYSSSSDPFYIQNHDLYDNDVSIGRPGDSGKPWVGIGIRKPSYKLHVNGACGATSFPNTSDIRLKDILSEWLPKLEDIANAPSFLFKWNNIKDDTVHLGSSAQYWEEKAPNVVTEANDEIKTKSLQYDVLGTVNSIAIAKEVVSLKEEIKLLQALIAELKLLLNN